MSLTKLCRCQVERSLNGSETAQVTVLMPAQVQEAAKRAGQVRRAAAKRGRRVQARTSALLDRASPHGTRGSSAAASLRFEAGVSGGNHGRSGAAPSPPVGKPESPHARHEAPFREPSPLSLPLVCSMCSTTFRCCVRPPAQAQLGAVQVDCAAESDSMHELPVSATDASDH